LNVKLVNFFYYIIQFLVNGGFAMKGSAKGRYGLQFMVDLALHAGRGPELVDAVAERQALPPKFLRVLLGSLKGAGLVKVQRGPSGGCELARHPSHITALQVLEALEGRLGGPALPPEASHGARAVRELWNRSTEAARDVLRHTTLADLAQRQQALEVDSQGYSI
jgi:Rrf2 family transcriptional regulator, iron-sulfur cluster assembly transcription factor